MLTRTVNYDVPFTFQMDVTTAGTPEALGVKLRAATIAFNENSADPDTITDSGSGFLVAGFQVGDTLTVSGSASNDGTYTIAAVTAGTITLKASDDLATEAAGATVKLTAPKVVPEGVDITIKAKNANTGTIHLANSSVRALNTSSGNFRLRNNESISLQVTGTDKVWLDASVSGEGVEAIFEQNDAA